MGVELGVNVIEASPSRNKNKDAVIPPVPDNLSLVVLAYELLC